MPLLGPFNRYGTCLELLHHRASSACIDDAAHTERWQYPNHSGWDCHPTIFEDTTKPRDEAQTVSAIVQVQSQKMYRRCHKLNCCREQELSSLESSLLRLQKLAEFVLYSRRQCCKTGSQHRWQVKGCKDCDGISGSEQKVRQFWCGRSQGGCSEVTSHSTILVHCQKRADHCSSGKL